MEIHEIRELNEVSTDANEHDSIRKHFQIVQKVKDYLARGVPNDVLLEIIKELEGRN